MTVEQIEAFTMLAYKLIISTTFLLVMASIMARIVIWGQSREQLTNGVEPTLRATKGTLCR